MATARSTLPAAESANTVERPPAKRSAAKTSRPAKTAKLVKRPATKRGRGYGAAYVYDSLRDDILSIRLQPGTLLDETELAGRFGVSRSPVREALIRLAGDGLVQTLRNRSSIVAPFDVSSVQGHLNAMLLMYCTTSRLAALNRSAGQLADLQAMLNEHRAEMATADMKTIVSNNRAFHVAVAEAGGNAFFTTWTASVLDQGQRLMGMYVQDTGQTRSDADLDDHAAIVDAIARSDADAAERAARADAMILFEQLRQHLFKDTLEGMHVGPILGKPAR
jgi:DNA-binding GntR family transcriptional regulator